MKRSKINLALIAVLFGIGAAFASTQKASAKQGSVLWGLEIDGVTWKQTTVGAHCTAASQVCKEDFPRSLKAQFTHALPRLLVPRCCGF